MSKSLCLSCAYMRRDPVTFHLRCYSPQLLSMRLGGILVNFERDAAPEEGRSAEAGNEKCGPSAKNRKPREGV